jgi:hypothetical protein
MMKLRWAILFTVLTVFLTACPGPETLTATLELTAAPNPVPAGGAPVELTATVTEGAENVASVDFAVVDATTAFDSDSDTTDNIYNGTTPDPVTADTRFVATARDADGNAIGSARVNVTVEDEDEVSFTLSATPNPVPVGGAAVTLSTLFSSGRDRVSSVAFSDGSGEIGVDSDGADGFSFTTATPVTADTTFVATARDGTGASLATAEVEVTVGTTVPVPPGATIADTLAEILAAPSDPPGGATVAAATIAVTADITCTGDPCIPLKVGQKLLGASTDGTTLLGTATRKITTNGSGATVIQMANNTSVEGFDFDGTGVYTAILAPGTVTGPVTIRNVRIGAVIPDSGSKPLDLNSSGAVTIEGLNIPDSIRAVDIDGFSSLTFNDSTIGFTLPAVGPTSALLIASQSGTVIVDGVTITTNRSDPLTFNPFFVNQISGAGTLNVTVTNSRVVVPTAGSNTARSFVFGVDAASTGGALAINTAASTDNSTNAGAGATYSSGVTGTIELTRSQ